MLSTNKSRRHAAGRPMQAALEPELLQACDAWAKLGDAAALVDASTLTLT